MNTSWAPWIECHRRRPCPSCGCAIPSIGWAAAANVARQVAALGAKVTLSGTIGKDAAGDVLLRLCADSGIDTRAIVRADNRRTTRKLRVLGHSQQLLRLDWEDASPCGADIGTRMLARLADEMPDAVILSDYAKGVITARSSPSSRRVSARSPWSWTPKRGTSQAIGVRRRSRRTCGSWKAAAGKSLDPTDTESIAVEARKLIATAGFASMVVTLSEHGMLSCPPPVPRCPCRPAAARCSMSRVPAIRRLPC